MKWTLHKPSDINANVETALLDGVARTRSRPPRGSIGQQDPWDLKEAATHERGRQRISSTPGALPDRGALRARAQSAANAFRDPPALAGAIARRGQRGSPVRSVRRCPAAPSTRSRW